VSITKLDAKGRLALPKELRERLEVGSKVLVINAGTHIKIIPLPKDPFKVLEGGFTTRKSFQQLRRQAEESASKEVQR
jgi:AbrB family looped-hinge helix DNA binding protein